MFAVTSDIEAKFRIVNMLYPTWVTMGEISYRGALPVHQRYDTVRSVEQRYDELLMGGRLVWLNNRSDELANWLGVSGWPFYTADILEFSSKLPDEVEHTIININVSL